MRLKKQRWQVVSGRCRYLLGSNRYCIRPSAVAGIVMPTVRPT